MPVQTQLLRRFPFFNAPSPAELTQLARAMTRRVVPAETMLIREGDPGDLFYMILKGDVEIFSRSGTLENRLNLLHAGDWFGELALIDNQPRSGSARTLTPATLLVLPKAEFQWLVTTYPVALYTLVATTQQRLRERDRAYEAEMETRLAQLQELHHTALDITKHLDRDKALEAIRERAVDLLQSAGGEIYLFDETRHLLVPQLHDGLDASPQRVDAGLEGRVFQSGGAARAPHHARCYELGAPIKLVDRAGVERTLGVLKVYRASDGAPYQDADETLLALFASQAAIVIENTELHKMRLAKERLDTELNSARRVQRSLILSKPPRVRGYQIAALWHPARQVSGDYYDFMDLGDGRHAFVIADVAGKGLDAALFMANARSILRACAIAGAAPAEIIRRANTMLTNDAVGGMFVTVFFAVLDPQTHQFSYVNAGHNLPLVWRAQEKAIETLPGGNLALGVLPGLDYSARVLNLECGDAVLLYTDGVTEATAANDSLFGEPRLIESLRASGDSSAQQIIRHLDEQVRAFTGAAEQSDDITVVAIRRV